MAQLSRGGPRPGAGRKPSLDILETLYVAGECAARWQALIHGRLEAEQQTHFGKSDYQATQAKLHAIPIAERLSFLSSEEGNQLLEDVEYSRREMAGLAPHDEADAPRLITFSVPRLYAARTSIIGDVAVWASARFGKPVSPRTVERAWKYLRSIQAFEK